MVDSQNKTQNVGANVGINVGVNVGTNEDKVIMLLRQDSKLTAKIIASTLGLTDRQVERILSKLKNEGKIVRHGASKNGYWEVCSVKESRGQPKNGALHQAVLSGNFLESIFDIENQEANGSSGGSNPSF